MKWALDVMMNNRQAFVGALETKEWAIARAADFRKAKAFHAFGHYWHEGKGNISGCMYHDFLKPGDPVQQCATLCESVHGIPWQIQEIADAIFGGLSCHDDKELFTTWAERFYEAIRPGADLLPVRDLLVQHMLEFSKWCKDFADEETEPQIDLMHSIYCLKVQGIDQQKRIKEFYYKYIHPMHHNKFNASYGNENNARAALKNLCSVNTTDGRGAFGYFLQSCVEGHANGKHHKRGQSWNELSKVFLRMLGDC